MKTIICDYAGTTPTPGNYFSFPGAATIPYPSTNGWPGAAVFTETSTAANVCGNTLASGAFGLFFADGCGNALVLNNDFGGAIFGGIGNGIGNTTPSLPTAQVISNKLAAGVTFHVALPPQYTNTFGWFLYNNYFINGVSSAAPPFLEPASSSVHVTY